MKIVGTVFLCFLFNFMVFGQSAETKNVEENNVEEITLFRDDGSGKMGDETEVFFINDVPIHCSILLSSLNTVTVKMNFVAVKAAGLKAESKIVSVSYKTNGKQNVVNFTASPADVWAAGKYRVDIFLDGKLSDSKELEITKPTAK